MLGKNCEMQQHFNTNGEISFHQIIILGGKTKKKWRNLKQNKICDVEYCNDKLERKMRKLKIFTSEGNLT